IAVRACHTNRRRKDKKVKNLIVTALSIGLAAALQPAAHAQFGSGIVYDPTQSVHAIRRSNTRNNLSPTNSSRSSRASKSLPTPSRLLPQRSKPTRRQAAVQ